MTDHGVDQGAGLSDEDRHRVRQAREMNRRNADHLASEFDAGGIDGIQLGITRALRVLLDEVTWLNGEMSPDGDGPWAAGYRSGYGAGRKDRVTASFSEPGVVLEAEPDTRLDEVLAILRGLDADLHDPRCGGVLKRRVAAVAFQQWGLAADPMGDPPERVPPSAFPADDPLAGCEPTVQPGPPVDPSIDMAPATVTITARQLLEIHNALPASPVPWPLLSSAGHEIRSVVGQVEPGQPPVLTRVKWRLMRWDGEVGSVSCGPDDVVEVRVWTGVVEPEMDADHGRPENVPWEDSSASNPVADVSAAPTPRAPGQSTPLGRGIARFQQWAAAETERLGLAGRVALGPRGPHLTAGWQDEMADWTEADHEAVAAVTEPPDPAGGPVSDEDLLTFGPLA